VCGLTIDTRRYWERAGPTLWPTPRAASGQRRYPERLPGPRRCASPRRCSPLKTVLNGLINEYARAA